MTAAAFWALTASSVLAALALLLATPSHRAGKEPWPKHATTHVWQGVAWATGLTAVSLLMIWGPLAEGERWAWWALVLSGAALYGGQLVPLLLREPGRLGRTDLAFFGGLCLVHAIALTALWSSTSPA